MTTTFPVTPIPTFEGFTAWIYAVMGVPPEWLPSDSPFIFYAYNTAVATVNDMFIAVPGPFYFQAVYNLGGHWLATWAPDPNPFPGDPPTPYQVIDGVPYGFFAYLRKQNNMLGFITGTVQSSGDEGTNVSLVVPDQAKNMTIGQMQLTTSPWGRYYLGIAQSIGTNWGIS